MWNIDLLDAHLDLLGYPSKYFVCLHNVFKTSARHVFKTSSRHVFKTCLQEVFSVKIFHLPRSLARCLHDALKLSSRSLARRKIVTPKTCSRRLQDMSWRCLEGLFKTNKYLLGSSSKTPSRRLVKTFWRRFEDVLKTSSRLLAKRSSRRLQDVLKTSSICKISQKKTCVGLSF